jgi:dephospho-CoA kinase
MIYIALAGQSCSGKNYVGQILEKCGFPVYDADLATFQAIEENKEIIKQRFGTTDRRALGKIIFTDPDARKALEDIEYPTIEKNFFEFAKRHEQTGHDCCIINAAVIYNSKIFEKIDIVFLVKAPLIVRLWRAKKRDHKPIREIWDRFLTQHNYEEHFKNKVVFRISSWFPFDVPAQIKILKEALDAGFFQDIKALEAPKDCRG